MNISSIIKLIRVKHWVKNLFVFIPAFFSGEINWLNILSLFMLFLAFSITASSIYVVNDMMDIEKDRMHPTKRNRPLASGEVSIIQAIILLFFLIVTMSLLLWFSVNAWKFILIYFLMNLLYSFWLKNISIIDISIISIGFVLRVLAGGGEIDVVVSQWLIVMVFLLCISLAISKRRDDLIITSIENKANLRKSLSGYTLGFIDTVNTMTFTITVIAYIMYTLSPVTIERMNSGNVYLTSIFVIVSIFRYIQITLIEEKSGSPIMILIKDKMILISLLLWVISFYFIIYTDLL